MKLILCTHGFFAEGIKSSIDLIVGNSENIDTVCITEDMTIQSVKDLLKEKLELFKGEEIILISDIAGGSSTQAMVEFLDTSQKIYGLTGLNLPMLLELSLSSSSAEEAIDSVLSNVGETVINLNQYLEI